MLLLVALTMMRIALSEGSLIAVYAMRMAAVFTLSVSTVGLRTSAMPRWVVYLGYLVALTLLVAAGEHKWFQLLFPAWVLLVSVVILFVRPLGREPSGSSRPTPATVNPGELDPHPLRAMRHRGAGVHDVFTCP